MTESNTSKRILIADDEQYIRELYQEVLVDAGFDVDVAADGKETLEKILAGGYDLIALDVIMPQLDGLGVLHELQNKSPKQKNGPIVLLTSLINDPAVKDAEGLGVKKIIYKTEVNPQQLINIVTEIVGKPAPKAQATPQKATESSSAEQAQPAPAQRAAEASPEPTATNHSQPAETKT